MNRQQKSFRQDRLQAGPDFLPAHLQRSIRFSQDVVLFRLNPTWPTANLSLTDTIRARNQQLEAYVRGSEYAARLLGSPAALAPRLVELNGGHVENPRRHAWSSLLR